MPLEPALNFQSEADFTSRFLVPLLRRLGYSIVVGYHGQREFGRDLVFGEIDRFGEVAYHGLQAKYVDSIGQAESEGLIEDCRQAFRHPFRHPNTGAEQRISTFVVTNAGSIGDNARDNFFAAAMGAEHGGNVRMFDGKALLALDRWATINRVEQVGEVLTGLLLEIEFNRRMLTEISRDVRNYCEGSTNLGPVERLRTAALSHYICRPFLRRIMDPELVNRYLFAAESHVNDGLKYMEGFAGRKDRQYAIETSILPAVVELEKMGDVLEASINAAIAELGPLATL